MTARGVIAVFLCMIFIPGCSTLSTDKVRYAKNYSVNTARQATISSPMIIFERTEYVRGSRPVGDVQSREHWERIEYASDGSFREELVYRGRSGNVIHITYREYRKDMFSPAFYKELNYDLGESDVFEFRHFRVRVLDATREYIRYVVLGD
ncbi:hypothetical protein BMS3Abin10_01927 [bacterium BMS3Abin10]|nr:hypothetical protein BMS3Abin10_01927 [bacterium BMS3Abin10]GBE38219.1 hypothetical protein BMS3Bbin08_00822 [bacterium BMS3Bbin08]HDH49839.1 hypothetical protein [Nitrospirota bacterium]